MMRRYEPAMRTVKSAERRLEQMAERAARAGELLRTRVDVERQAQNQGLLESMDRRADLALRLQHTVEGLSVVAISYYAVSLAAYVAAPFRRAPGAGQVGADGGAGAGGGAGGLADGAAHPPRHALGGVLTAHDAMPPGDR